MDVTTKDQHSHQIKMQITFFATSRKSLPGRGRNCSWSPEEAEQTKNFWQRNRSPSRFVTQSLPKMLQEEKNRTGVVEQNYFKPVSDKI